MAIASISLVTIMVYQSEGCIRVFERVGGVDSCLHERDMAVPTIRLFILCILLPGYMLKWGVIQRTRNL